MFRFSGSFIQGKPSGESKVDRMQAGIARALVHELKNKLTSMDIAIAQLQECLTPEDCNNKAAFLLTMLQRSSAQVNEVLLGFYKSVVTEELEKKETNINHLLEKIVKDIRASQNVSAFHIIYEPLTEDFTMLVDEGKLSKAFSAIISNAIEAIPPERKGHIKIQLSKTSPHYVRIAISDNGAGIAPDILEHIFEPFFTTKPNAAGFGLAYAKKMIQQHGGFIRVDSLLREGAAFQLTLPCLHAIQNITPHNTNNDPKVASIG